MGDICLEPLAVGCTEIQRPLYIPNNKGKQIEFKIYNEEKSKNIGIKRAGTGDSRMSIGVATIWLAGSGSYVVREIGRRDVLHGGSGR